MTKHDIPNRRRRGAFVVGATVAVGLVASVGLQLSGSTSTMAAMAPQVECAGSAPALIAL
jgi:hypothetical protein